ncbi:MAG TPA: polyphosphate kinase 1 [Terriglobales bacterium]|nr:polyphosphate kinase 1 [Terriglobales bacterium]
MAISRFDQPANYINRHASWLGFNERVLEEAEDDSNPLLERVKFLAITAGNLDEFFEIRLAGLLQQIEDGVREAGPDGLAPAAQMELLRPRLQAFAERQHRCWNLQLLPHLAAEGIRMLEWDALAPRARAFAAALSRRELDPLLTPITVDPAHPFPRVQNKALCLAFLLRGKRGHRGHGGNGGALMGVVTVPRALPRLIRLPRTRPGHDFMLLAHLVARHAQTMYRGYRIEAAVPFRLTRNSNLYLQEEESRNLLETVRDELHNLRKGNAVRLEVEENADPEVVERLRANFELEPWQVFAQPGPVNLSRLFNLYELTPRPDLKFPRLRPRPSALAEEPSRLFQELRAGDRLLHHPFDSYHGVIALLAAAARDQRVLSIKQTLYRTTADSPILHALIAAAGRKEVAVVVELQARFDEASNIAWAGHLQDAGVQVFFGAAGHKTHCKLALIVRHDEDGVTRRYAHLATGNYNHRTARQYTDFSLFTSDRAMTTAVQAVFDYLTAYADRPGYGPLLVAPVNLAAKLAALIRREARHARQGRPARIIAKLNGLLDKFLISELYAASCAGVQIDLLVRGACALRPGIAGLSSRIRVRSLVGRFLEHSRIVCFANGGADEIYLGSADWMPRNLYERVEVVFPVRDPALRHRLRHQILAAYLADNAKTRWMQPDGSYLRPPPKARGFNAQEFLLALSQGAARAADLPAEARPPRPRLLPR